jgi:hypothetical protein
MSYYTKTVSLLILSSRRLNVPILSELKDKNLHLAGCLVLDTSLILMLTS